MAALNLAAAVLILSQMGILIGWWFDNVPVVAGSMMVCILTVVCMVTFRIY